MAGAFAQCRQPLVHCGCVLRGHEIIEVRPLQVGARVAQEPRQSGVDGGHCSVKTRQCHAKVHLHEDRAEALLRNLELLVKLAPLERQSGLRRDLINQLAGHRADPVGMVGHDLKNPQQTRACLQGYRVCASLAEPETLAPRVTPSLRNVDRAALPNRPCRQRVFLEGNGPPGFVTCAPMRHSLEFAGSLVKPVDLGVLQPFAFHQTREDSAQHQFGIQGTGQRRIHFHQQRELVRPGRQFIVRPDSNKACVVGHVLGRGRRCGAFRAVHRPTVPAYERGHPAPQPGRAWCRTDSCSPSAYPRQTNGGNLGMGCPACRPPPSQGARLNPLLIFRQNPG